MVQHAYRCDPCDGLFRVEASISSPPPEHPTCPQCKGRKTRKDYHATGAPNGIVRGGTRRGKTDYQELATGISNWHKKRNPDPDRPSIARQRDTVKRLKKIHQAAGRQRGPLRHIGSIPVDEWHTRKLQTGNNEFWQQEMAERGAKTVLKEHDCYLGEG